MRANLLRNLQFVLKFVTEFIFFVQNSFSKLKLTKYWHFKLLSLSWDIKNIKNVIFNENFKINKKLFKLFKSLIKNMQFIMEIEYSIGNSNY